MTKLELLFKTANHLELVISSEGNSVIKGQHGYVKTMDHTKYTLDRDAISGEWMGVYCSCKPLKKEDKAEEVQLAVEVELNRPDYNESRRDLRHADCLFDEYRADEKNGLESIGVCDPLPECLVTDEETQAESLIRDLLKGHSNWAEVFIAKNLKGQTIRDYAKENGISEKLASYFHVQAVKFLKEKIGNPGKLHDLLADK